MQSKSEVVNSNSLPKKNPNSNSICHQTSSSTFTAQNSLVTQSTFETAAAAVQRKQVATYRASQLSPCAKNTGRSLININTDNNNKAPRISAECGEAMPTPSLHPPK